MTTGALIYALDNEHIDYVAMAVWCAANIRRHLGIPCAIATDSDRIKDHKAVDAVIPITKHNPQQKFFQDLDCTMSWHNDSRPTAADITPWSRTLLVDADYVVASDFLQRPLCSDQPFLCYGTAHNVASSGDPDPWDLNQFGRHRFPMRWATVMIFDQCAETRYIFGVMTMIRNHWPHYCQIYGINKSMYRNDYALSMALMFVNGHSIDAKTIPGNLLSVMPDHRLSQIGPDGYDIQYTDAHNNPRRTRLEGVDFHAMCKSDLGKIIETAI